MNYPTLGEEVQICFVFLNIPCLTKVAQQFVAHGSFNFALRYGKFDLHQIYSVQIWCKKSEN